MGNCNANVWKVGSKLAEFEMKYVRMSHICRVHLTFGWAPRINLTEWMNHEEKQKISEAETKTETKRCRHVFPVPIFPAQRHMSNRINLNVIDTDRTPHAPCGLPMCRQV